MRRGGTRGDMIAQQKRDRNLVFRRFAERHAYGVAETLMQQRTDTDGALDAAVLGVSGLRDAEMKGIAHPLLLQFAGKKTHRLDHHHRVGGLDRDHDVVEIHLAGDAQILHHRLHHTGRSVAVTAHDAVGKRTMVHTETHGCAVLAA